MHTRSGLVGKRRTVPNSLKEMKVRLFVGGKWVTRKGRTTPVDFREVCSLIAVENLCVEGLKSWILSSNRWGIDKVLKLNYMVPSNVRKEYKPLSSDEELETATKYPNAKMELLLFAENTPTTPTPVSKPETGSGPGIVEPVGVDVPTGTGNVGSPYAARTSTPIASANHPRRFPRIRSFGRSNHLYKMAIRKMAAVSESNPVVRRSPRSRVKAITNLLDGEDPVFEDNVGDRSGNNDLGRQCGSLVRTRRLCVLHRSFDNGPQPIEVNMMKPNIANGVRFANVNSFRVALSQHCILNGRAVNFIKSDKKRVTAECEDPKCKWRIYTARLNDCCVFQIKTIRLPHTCSFVNKRASKMANQQWIVYHCLPWLFLHEGLTVQHIRDQLQRLYGLELSYKRVLGARNLALKKLHGNDDR